MLLDTALLRRRRTELALSHRAVARHLGVTSATAARIEDGRNHAELPLRLLCRLADLLAVDVADLVGQQPEPTGPTADARRLGALLATAGEPVLPATLADALELTAGEVEGLLDRLDADLRPAGLRLHRGNAGVSIVADGATLDDARLRQLLRGQHARHGLTRLEAQLLARAAAGTLDPTSLGIAYQVALARLVNAGLVDADGNLDDDVRFSLELP